MDLYYLTQYNYTIKLIWLSHQNIKTFSFHLIPALLLLLISDKGVYNQCSCCNIFLNLARGTFIFILFRLSVCCSKAASKPHPPNSKAKKTEMGGL